MQIIKRFTKLLFFIFPAFAVAQSTYVEQGSKAYHFMDRLEIKQQTNTHLNFSALKPFNRKAIVTETEFLDSARKGYTDSIGVDKYKEWTDLDLTPIDEYNLHSLLMNNTEWVTGARENFLSKKPFLKSFYQTKPNFLEVKTNDFFIAVNPVIQYVEGKQSGYGPALFLNSRGITARGLIGKKIGFSTFLTDNQERGPLFFQQRVAQFGALPGAGFYKPFKTQAYDYFDARGYITFNAAKFVDIQFGYDKNFIGDGYRSLFLSDYSNGNLFLKLNTKFWKFNYQNLFMELQPQFKKTNDTLLDRKFAAMHHLSLNATKWLNVGVFEGIIFGRKNVFELQYLNPIIFLRYSEGNIGSPDNAVAGLDFKANIAHRLQFYGQFLLDEFVLADVRHDPTNWVNKWGIQAGLKYIDAFGIRNLDVQLETNRVRPFTYSHDDSIGNYTHYNQPLAHPLGANFQEVLAIVNYQPAPKWYINAKLFYYYQGLDSAGYDFGSNPLENYILRPRQTGFKIGSGDKVNCFNGIFMASYEMKENLYIDLSFQYRNYKVASGIGTNTTQSVSLGIRLNILKRDYDY